jgi:superfamily II DNA or RNA helicase
MAISDHQAKYFAHELTRRYPADSVEKLAGAVAGAQVDLNPHQVDAALFAFSSPLSKGVLLADEVGLGKTIEAGLVISQKWAERKRRVLVITPANLRKQWHQELSEKFFLPCRILESKPYNAAIREGRFRPFEVDDIVICSYQFARAKAADVANTPWDLVVIDEAHRLRNVYKPGNVIANTLKKALEGRHKLLLTATPLQNSLLELFGLASIIDEHAFGDVKSFREQFSNLSQELVFQTLKNRLKPLCHRTLRRQVTAYIPYTRRMPLVEEFTPEQSEDELYEMVSEYLRRPNLQALPSGQRSLMTLVLRKLLASSTFAIAGALQSIANRLRGKLKQQAPLLPLEEELDQDYEALDGTSDEWAEESPDEQAEPLSESDIQALEQEIADLDAFAKLATSIEHNAKGKALLKALTVAMDKAVSLGAAQKAIIFTESRRTQNYLLRLLADSPWKDGLVLFNGANTDERSKAIYADWLTRHQGSDRITGSRTADMRSALVDYFREQGQIMIATEAAAEGINLQFCSLVVNYDLPWNPQRIEQRIGRCHRYGQKHDVVVVNFLNRKNQADQRVFQLLSEKFQLFEGVFGASDEVLGALESGVDFEKRINDIYQRCRKPDEIKQAFDQLQLELSFEINEAMTQTRRKLLEHFDDEVREKLRVQDASSKSVLGQFERLLMRLTRHELQGAAEFIDGGAFRLLRLQGYSFRPSEPIAANAGATHAVHEAAPRAGDIPLGLYELPRRSGEAHTYRLGCPLADTVVEQAKARELPAAELTFSYEDHDGKISILEPFRGTGGMLSVSLFTVESLDQAEDHLILAGVTDSGEPVEEEVIRRMLTLPASPSPPASEGRGLGEMGAGTAGDSPIATRLETLIQDRQSALQRTISERNARYFEAEVEKLDGWADDLKLGLEREIKEMDRQIKEARRASASALTLDEKLAGQKQVRALESLRKDKRKTLFDAQDDVDARRDSLVSEIEGKLGATSRVERLFDIQWKLC